jgi:hypothetical protein
MILDWINIFLSFAGFEKLSLATAWKLIPLLVCAFALFANTANNKIPPHNKDLKIDFFINYSY